MTTEINVKCILGLKKSLIQNKTYKQKLMAFMHLIPRSFELMTEIISDTMLNNNIFLNALGFRFNTIDEYHAS